MCWSSRPFRRKCGSFPRGAITLKATPDLGEGVEKQVDGELDPELVGDPGEAIVPGDGVDDPDEADGPGEGGDDDPGAAVVPGDVVDDPDEADGPGEGGDDDPGAAVVPGGGVDDPDEGETLALWGLVHA